jgi:hypothetical protein
MKKMVLLVTAIAFLASASLVMARETNRESLNQQWAVVQAEQKKLNDQFKALDSTAKPQADNPKAKAKAKKKAK